MLPGIQLETGALKRQSGAQLGREPALPVQEPGEKLMSYKLGQNKRESIRIFSRTGLWVGEQDRVFYLMGGSQNMNVKL